jgi:hypothetical protein
MIGKHGRGSFVRNDKELVLSPSTEKLGGAQALNEGLLDFFHHGFAGACAVCLAQIVSLIDTDPENPKGRAAPDVIFDQALEAVFKVCLARFHRLILAGFSAWQSIELVCGMKEDARADTLPEAVAEDQIADDDGHFMTQVVADASKEGAPWLRSCICSGLVVNGVVAQ